MGGRFKNRFAIGAAALAVAALAGGAYAASHSGSNSRQAFVDDVAKRLNVSPDQLRAALKAATIDRLNAAVKDGRLTQAQADAIERRLNEGELPFFGFHRGFERGFRHAGLSAAAGYLGLSDAQLFDQLSRGKSLAQVAKEHGKTTSGLEQAMTTELKSRLDKAVSSGFLNQRQEQAILSRFQARLDRMVNRTPRFGRPHGMPDGSPTDGPPMDGPPPPGLQPPYAGGPGAPAPLPPAA